MFESPSLRFSITLYVGQKRDFDITVFFVQGLFFCTSLYCTLHTSATELCRCAHTVQTWSLWLAACWRTTILLIIHGEVKYQVMELVCELPNWLIGFCSCGCCD